MSGSPVRLVRHEGGPSPLGLVQRYARMLVDAAGSLPETRQVLLAAELRDLVAEHLPPAPCSAA